MPTYEYQCEKCGVFEVVQKITENSLTNCPTCSSNVKRLVSAPAFHLKGSGWYKTDYASSSSSSSADKSGKSVEKSSDSPKAEASSSASTEKSESSSSNPSTTPSSSND